MQVDTFYFKTNHSRQQLPRPPGPFQGLFLFRLQYFTFPFTHILTFEIPVSMCNLEIAFVANSSFLAEIVGKLKTFSM